MILSKPKDHGFCFPGELTLGVYAVQQDMFYPSLRTNTSEYGNISIPSSPATPPTGLSSYAMGKLLAQHLQNIITVLFYILLLESRELKADIFPFHDLKTFINLITPVFA